MYCDECRKNPATVHVTRIINGKKQEAHLCEECARGREEMKGNMFTPFSINDLLASFLDMGQPSPQQMAFESVKVPKCSRCGMTYNDFKKVGRLGCSHCYKAFRNELAPVLRRVHGSVQHGGKYPKVSGAQLMTRRRIEKLKADLNRAIQEEAFEQAAKLRDQIRELEKMGQPRKQEPQE